MNQTLCNCDTNPKKELLRFDMRKSFQFRIYPTKKQEVALERTLTTCRHLYNNSLAERKRQAELTEYPEALIEFVEAAGGNT
jgi:Helix-turn-helix domain